MAKVRKLAALVMLTIAGVCGGGKLQAQNYLEDPKTFYAGLIVGANFTQVDGDNYAGYHKVGLNAGGIAYAQLADKLALSIEMLFSQKGARGHFAKASGIPGIIIQEYRSDLNYAEIPIQLNYFDKRKSHFGAGFSYSQLISSKEMLVTNASTYNTEYVSQYPFRKYDVNFVAGGNLHLWKGFFLNLRFQYSLVPVRASVPFGFGRAQQFNNMWTVRLMYLFI